jgi:predicted small lipoprotein YifL
MKKALSILLLLAMLFTLFACGPKETAESTPTPENTAGGENTPAPPPEHRRSDRLL